MSVFTKHRDTLEHHETMMGTARGRLAVALDLLTDSLALVGQHGVYCRSERLPGQPRMDIALVLEQLDDAKRLGRTGAITVVSAEIASSPQRRDDFLRHAAAATAVSHPNIVALYEVGQEEGQLYLVSEFVQGQTLRTIIGG